MATLGEQVVDELRRRGEYGMYFDEAGYAALKEIDTFEGLRRFLEERGYGSAPEGGNATEIVAHLASRVWELDWWGSVVCAGSGLAAFSLQLVDEIPIIGVPTSLLGLGVVLWATVGLWKKMWAMGGIKFRPRTFAWRVKLGFMGASSSGGHQVSGESPHAWGPARTVAQTRLGLALWSNRRDHRLHVSGERRHRGHRVARDDVLASDVGAALALTSPFPEGVNRPAGALIFGEEPPEPAWANHLVRYNVRLL